MGILLWKIQIEIPELKCNIWNLKGKGLNSKFKQVVEKNNKLKDRSIVII